MRETVIVTKGHSTVFGWKKPGESYQTTRQYAKLLEAIGLVSRGEVKAPEVASPVKPAQRDDDNNAADGANNGETLDLEALRTEHLTIFGEKPHHKASAAKIAAKIEEHKAASEGIS